MSEVRDVLVVLNERSGGAMATSVVTVRREDLLQRRAEILESLGMSLEQFATVSATHAMSGAEWDAREELDDIAFLLGESAS